MADICVFGDSLTKGVVLDGESGRYHILKENFMRAFCRQKDLELSDHSKMGATITQGREIFLRAKGEPGEAKCCIFEYGGNDSDFLWKEIAENPEGFHPPKTSLLQYKKDYIQLISLALEEGAGQVGVLNLPPLEPERYFRWVSRGINGNNILKWLCGSVEFIYRFHESYNMALGDICAATGAILLDIRSAFLESKDYGQFLCIDGIHPNAAGHCLIKETLLASSPLKEMLKSPRKVSLV